MRLTSLRLVVVIALVVGASIAATPLAASPLAAQADAPAASSAAGAAGAYSPAEWWPLRGTNLIGCTTRSPGPVCGGSHHSVNAMDIEGPEGQAVYAAGAGLATVYSSSAGCSNYGKTVVVDHGPNGKTLYSHLSGFSPALNAAPGGVWVDENTVIGFVGHTGSVSGCSYNHLHFEYSATGSWGSGASLIPDLKGCVGSEVRTYPDIFGQSGWVALPGHTFRAVSDGTGCASPGRPIGSVDVANGRLGGYAEVRGWTIDPDASGTATQVRVYVDGAAGSGAASVTIDANLSRPDVANVAPGAGPWHGYSNAVGGLAAGSHTLYIYAVNVAGTPGSDTLLGAPTISVPAAPAGMPIGSFDSATALVDGTVQVSGWALDPDASTTSTTVNVYVDSPAGSGASPITVPAAASRPDVAAAFPGAGALHGFSSAISGLAPGPHTVWVYAANVTGPTGNPLLGTRTVTVTGPPCADGSLAGPFTDVGPAHAFCQDIAWMLAGEIDTGYPDDTFRPTTANTREMLAVQLYNYANRPLFAAPTAAPFTDVSANHPHATEIAWLAGTGIATGYGDGSFQPTAAVSRQAMAAFFHRLAGTPPLEPTAVGATFGDVGPDHTFHDQIAWLASTGISTGYGDGNFQPTSPITRQALAAFLHRYDAL